MNRLFVFIASALVFLGSAHSVDAKPYQEPQWARRVAVQTAIFERLLQKQMDEDWSLWHHRDTTSYRERHTRFRVTKCLVSAPYHGKQAAISTLVFQRLRSRRVGKCLVADQERWLKQVERIKQTGQRPHRTPKTVLLLLLHLRFTSSNEALAQTIIADLNDLNSRGEPTVKSFSMKLKRANNDWQVTSMLSPRAAN
ncbi:hypothetical protein IAD21_02386 [Abditibacteriota bacterium]|nr:hypothetical protein IAD21_02386 [Abditibacteriota bacterium]